MKEVIINKTKELLEKMGFEAEVSFIERESLPLVTVTTSSENSGFLIGKAGVSLEAFEHIVKLIVNKEQKDSKANFILDINDYRQVKTKNLVELARSAAERVVQTSKSEALHPMNAFERRIVHLELASLKDISTESIGTDPKRRIVIKPHFIRR